MKMEYQTNKYQTPLTDELLASLPKEVKADLIDFIEGVKFIRWLISPENIRGFAKNKPKDEEGKIIVDITKPHILEDMDFFRERAIHHEKYNCYTKLHPNSNPKSEYSLFWKEEVRRWKEGLVRPSDGEWIPGLYYFYLNYSPIWVNVEVKTQNKSKAKVKGDRKRRFPDVYLGDYMFFHYLHQARESGAHGKMLKSRGIGASFKFGAITPCTMYTEPGLPCFHLASDKTFLEGDKGVFGKVTDVLDWVGENTPLPRLRLVDKPLEKQIGYKDEYGARQGLKSSVFGISMKDNPDKARGIRGPIIHYEEDGLFPNLENAWNVNRNAVEGGGVVFGLMFAAGCVCAGTKVWNNNGDLINIENLNPVNGILGYDGKKVSKETISYWQPPKDKPCYRITTNTNRTLECSEDHPILWSRQDFGSQPRIDGKRPFIKKTIFKETKDIKIGDQIAIIEEVPIFGDKKMWNPRLIGWLIGDGTYGIDHSPRLSNCEIEINSYVEKHFDAKTTKEYITKEGKIYKEIRLKGVCGELRKLKIYGQTGLAKTLPENIHSYIKDDICELIGGLIDTDGYIGYKGIELSSQSLSLLQEVQLLLQKLGIQSNINFKKPSLKNPKSKNGHYNLEICARRSILKFIDCITLFPKHKKEALIKLGETFKNKTEQNSKSIEGITFERVTNLEYIGIKPVYNLTASTTNTYIANGIVTHNTGGTVGADFAGSEKLFYKPDTYNIYGLPNVFDKNTNEYNKCGFFWGAYLNRARYYDKSTGEPDVVGALIEILNERYLIKYSSSDPNAITQKKAEEPITPQEAVMRRDGTVFPVSDLKDYLSEVMPNLKSFVRPHFVGRLVINTAGNVEFVEDLKLDPIRDYPLTDTLNREGAVEIFEKPQYLSDNKIEAFRYISGIDPIDSDDNVTTDSLPSIFIFDRYTDRIVAEYTGRYKTANEFYELCKRLLMYYGATANYENNLKGLFAYFENHHCTHLLCDNPSILDEKGIANSKGNFGNKKKGTTATPTINAWARRLQADWMVSPAYGSEEGSVKLNLHKIRSIGYLKEAIAWNVDGNFDRVSAMGMLMIYREEVAKMEIRRTKDRVKQQFSDPWWDKHFKQGKKEFML